MKYIFCFLTLVFGLCAGGTAHAKVFIVDTEIDTLDSVLLDSHCQKTSLSCSLRSAINISNTNNESDRIYFNSSIKKINLIEQLVIEDDVASKQDVILRGTVILDAQKNGRVLFNKKGVNTALSGITLQNGLVTSTLDPHGGGIFNQGKLHISHGNIQKNQVEIKKVFSNSIAEIFGGGIYNDKDATLTLYQTKVKRNLVGGTAGTIIASGAGIYNKGELNIYKSKIIGNHINIKKSDLISHIYTKGGGIFSNSLGEVNILDSEIDTNQIRSSNTSSTKKVELLGAGIYTTSKSTTIDRSGINQNIILGDNLDNNTSIKLNGAGLHVSQLADAKIINSTISNNTLKLSGTWSPNKTKALGTGLYVGKQGHAHIANSTIAFNTKKATTSGDLIKSEAYGLFVYPYLSDGVVLKNSIVSNHDVNCNILVESHGFNVIDDNSCVSDTLGSQIDTDPLLKSLVYDGKYSKIHALSVTSPAIDAGNPAGCFDFDDELIKVDQRGQFRSDATCDVGAFEL